MKLAVFSAKPYDKLYLTQERVAALKANRSDGEGEEEEEEEEEGVEIVYHEFALNAETASLAAGARVVCVFVNDTLSAAVLGALREQGVRAVLLRCAGYNNVDLAAAARLGLFVASVPSYSPEAVAEFAVALVQTLNRGTHRAYNRVREGNFSLDGLLGRTLHGRTVGVVGTGRIGVAFARIMRGFGCELLAYDPYPSADFTALGGAYGTLEEVLGRADVVSLHCPLTEGTRYLINAATLRLMKADAVLVNTSRGALVDTKAVIAALKARRLGGLALDVYEHERALFYDDHSGTIIDDDDLMRLTTFHNVLVCGHQAFFTDGALEEIAATTVRNLEDFLRRRPCKNALVQPNPESDDAAAAAAPSMLARSDTIPIRI